MAQTPTSGLQYRRASCKAEGEGVGTWEHAILSDDQIRCAAHANPFCATTSFVPGIGPHPHRQTSGYPRPHATMVRSDKQDKRAPKQRHRLPLLYCTVPNPRLQGPS